MSGFLTQPEINLIKRDFVDFVNSPGGVAITLRWVSGHTGTWDETYQAYRDDDTVVYSELAVRAAYKSVTLGFIRKYGWGEALLGSVVFYISPAVDLSDKPGLSVLQTVAGEHIIWHVLSPQPTIPEGLRVPLGSDMVSQSVVCRREK